MRIRVYLENSNALALKVVRKALYERISMIEYTNNVRAADLKINCLYINKDHIHLHKANMLKEIETKFYQLNKKAVI